MTYEGAENILLTRDEAGNCEKFGDLFFEFTCKEMPLDEFLRKSKVLANDFNKILKQQKE